MLNVKQWEFIWNTFMKIPESFFHVQVLFKKGLVVEDDYLLNMR